MTRVLLGQLGSNGDCFYATTVARQMRHDFPGARLTWAISSLCRDVIRNNPDIDEVWEVPAEGWEDIRPAWRRFVDEATAKGFDHVFLTQINPDGFRNYDGTVRTSIFRNYGRPITVPVETVIVLTEEERANVAAWSKRNRLADFRNVVLFECFSKSGQSFVTPDIAVEISKQVIASLPDTLVLLSVMGPLKTDHPQIILCGELSLREISALTSSVDLFVGCGSGVTVVATSSSAKRELPMIQILSRETSVYASFKHDLQFFGKPVHHILETSSLSISRLAKTIEMALRDGIGAAELTYGESMPLNFYAYCEKIDINLLRRGMFEDAANSVKVTIDRYGAVPQLVNFAKSLIAPGLSSKERVGLLDFIHDRISLREVRTQDRY